MAQHLEEQEQLDEIKAFWKRYGNAILTLLIAVLGSYVGWNYWQSYQQGQGLKASAMYDELDKAVVARDAAKAARVFEDLKARYPKTLVAQQGGLLLARLQFESKQVDEAQASLNWVSDNATTEEYKSLARLRLAGVLMESKKFDEALRLLDQPGGAPAFDALVADRRGDILLAQGKKEEAGAAYTKAWKAMDAKVEYRRVVEGKLGALGIAVDEAVPVASGAAASGVTP